MRNFKVVLALTASLTMFQAFADSCLGEICSGERVITKDGTVLKVISIDAAKSEVVGRNSSGHIYSMAPTLLSDEISSSKFPVGINVINENNDLGIATVAFRNGEVVYKVTAGYEYHSKNLSPEVERIGGFSKKVQILNSNNDQGTVEHVFENNSVLYKVSAGYVYAAKISTLSFEVPENGLFKVGTKSLNSNNDRGTVTAVFSDGRVSYKVAAGYEYVGNVKNMTAAIPESGAFKTGTIILNSNSDQGVVTDVFQDGRLMYKVPAGYEYSARASTTTYEIESLEGGTFRNGINVLNESNDMGVIQKTFADGRMSYKVAAGYTYVSSKLIPEVATHETYNKDTEYASAGNEIGKPKRFYANGMVLIGPYVTRTLHAEVVDFNGVSQGSEVIDLDKSTFIVDKIFANGAARVEDEKKKSLVLKVKTTKEVLSEDAAFALMNLSGKITKDNKLSYHTDAFLLADALAFKRRLIMALKADRNTNETEKNKFINFFKANLLDGEEDLGEPTELPQTPAPTSNGLTYLVSISPDSMIKQVKALLDSKKIEYILATNSEVNGADYGLYIAHTKSLIGGTCKITLKQGSVEINQDLKGTGLKNPKACINELKKLLN